MTARSVACLVAGASLALFLPAAAMAAGGCDRESFGGWRQSNHNDTRARVLERDAVGQIAYTTSASGRTRITTGGWTDFMTGITYRDLDAGRVQIDHIIPVCFAWHHGASDWTRAERRAFYNDMSLLVVTRSEQNGKKGDSLPSLYMPDDPARACTYISRFIDGVARHRLALAEDELTSLENARAATCSGTATTRL